MPYSRSLVLAVSVIQSVVHAGASWVTMVACQPACLEGRFHIVFDLSHGWAAAVGGGDDNFYAAVSGAAHVAQNAQLTDADDRDFRVGYLF